MVNLILNAVTTQLGTTFGNPYHYYVEDVEQGLVKPCFTVDVLLPHLRSKSPILYDRAMPIVVHYFGGSKQNIKNECYAMGEQVVECLEYLPFQNTILRGEDMSYQIVDDVLQVFVTYRFTTRRVSEIEDSMETLNETVTHTN